MARLTSTSPASAIPLIHESHGRRWAFPPGVPMLDSDKRHMPDGARPGKYLYSQSIKFRDRDVRERWSGAVLAALGEAGITPWLEEV